MTKTTLERDGEGLAVGAGEAGGQQVLALRDVRHREAERAGGARRRRGDLGVAEVVELRAEEVVEGQADPRLDRGGEAAPSGRRNESVTVSPGKNARRRVRSGFVWFGVGMGWL